MSRQTEVLLSAVEQLSPLSEGASSPENSLKRLLNGINRVLSADQLVALVFDTNGREYRAVLGTAIDPCQEHWLRRRIPDAGGEPEVSLVGREYWDGAAGDERCLGAHLRSGALVAIPCGENWGVLLVAYHTDHLFSDQELTFLRIFANLAGVSLESKMLGASDSESELQDFSRQRLSVQEGERQRIAAELHDGIGQNLAAVKYLLEGALLEHGKSNGTVARDTLTTTLHSVQSTIDEVRRVAMDLRPAMLDDLGLQPTLAWFCRQFREIYRPLRVHLQFGLDEDDLDPGLRVPIYRICQEALNNIAKHAKAKCAEVSLTFENGRLLLRISDDGVGLNTVGNGGFGLKNMRERAELSGGRLVITRGKPSGLAIEASWSIPEPDLPRLGRLDDAALYGRKLSGTHPN
ncbi:GAF domain-containing sensor histidine kinase [Thiohalomonas denitrificans]|uniref:GAF domain-containing sensor histidine kinase n=1 Tax=Thiohalomonas denitrificans TaxID=415747 RepID=UPI0026F372A4|nr:GAF domain-containing sensor histidine kinase [Thiohalomonas denitrificans]